jgi:Phosphotransferase enzyme family
MPSSNSNCSQSGPAALHGGGNVVRRELRGNHYVYVKQYATDNWDATQQVISQRLKMEVAALHQLSQQPHWPRRLGRIQVEDVDIGQGIITTSEVQGISLEDWVRNFKRCQYRESLGLFYLAGSWLRHFQQMKFKDDDFSSVGDKNPTDLCEYLSIRLNALKACQYRGLTEKQYAALLERTSALSKSMAPNDKRLVICHNDYSPGNIISDGYSVTPIDFQMTAWGTPLQDVAYFLHRLEMTRLFRPWLIRPWKRWRHSFVRGYGHNDLERTPLYEALTIRLLVLRLLTYSVAKPVNKLQAVHNQWVLAAVRHKLLKLMAS